MAIKFKGVDLDGDLERVIPHVAAAEEYGGALQHLQSVWDNLTLLGELSGNNTDMSGTRVAFRELAERLLNQLGREALRKCLQDLSAKAQVAINILVRNLFERTADIGFLSGDDDIRAFLRDPAGRDDKLAGLRRRFGEYVRKYSVYSDIIVLDPNGNVLARLDETVGVATSSDSVIRSALETKAAYVESFHVSDLVTGRNRSLIYSYRVTDHNGAVLGVLCLCFRLENEAELIFSNLVGHEDWSVVTILDEAGTVIASSAPFHIPVGAKLKPVLDAEYRIVRFGPMEYIAVTRAAQPYQGYAGPGWYAHVMVPLVQAFATNSSEMLAGIEPAMIERIISSSELFNDDMRAIPAKAEHIQRELNRSVWNGNLRQKETVQGNGAQAGRAAFSKTLLNEISNTGAKTKDVFRSSIADLNKTVVTSLLHDNQFHAALAIDIMDRNLYERANDCRWWALTATFAELLAKPSLSEADRQTIRSILQTINGLYTVYSNLIVFDRSRRIVAVSAQDCREIEGTVLDEEWASRILSLRGDQAYAVSSFAPTRLYKDRPTYIYGAAIADPKRHGTIGGVAIVFDSAPQFAAMLVDALPRDGAGAVKRGAFGLMVEPGGKIISCSDDHLRSGETIAIDPAFLQLAPGGSHYGFTAVGENYYAVGAQASSGYREYKGPDDAYRNTIIALILTPLCDVGTQVAKAEAASVTIRSDRMQTGIKEEIATFFIGARPFAARAAEIIEAIDATGLVGLPLMPLGMTGCLMYRGAPLPVFDILRVLENAGDTASRAATQVVVMESSKGERFGLMVDRLGEIVEVAEDRVRFLPSMVAAEDTFADAALTPDGVSDGQLVVVLRADQLYANLSGSVPPIVARTKLAAA
ncbi:MAG TPA: chemotaxis protein CheW [Xanthobacteraceae bacterium]|jgi:chemotaxis signal transduction protein|nr:chemotaxis protein CheW [Xanthobacteraceae bacterium]